MKFSIPKKKKYRRNHIHTLLLCLSIAFAFSESRAQPKPPVPLSFQKGKLVYSSDSSGNRIPDFSYCGYKAGEVDLPFATTGIIIPLIEGDATLRIQSALDYIATLPFDKNGIRGAVILQKGNYTVSGTLFIRASGIILKGAGFGDNGTTLTGSGRDRATLIIINGNDDRHTDLSKNINDEYVPVNAQRFHVGGTNDFKAGDNILVTRPATKEWIDILGTDHFGGGITALGWKPDQRNIKWLRTISAVDGNTITIDAPLTASLDKKYGGATIAKYTWEGRIENCGIENLKLVSDFDPANPKDEDHRWMAITIDNARDCWVSHVAFRHFAGSAVAVYRNAARITVEDCISLQPVSEIGGERRNTFFTEGQQTLFQRCYAEYGVHDFATGFCAAGPNAFVQCESKQPYSFSGGIDSWSAGVLFDIVNVDGQAISYKNLGQDRQGAGWNIANGVLWNSSAARIDCYQPPTAQNWAFGSWSQFAGDGYWAESNNSIEPRSLYYAQLKERIGNSVNRRTQVMNIETDASSSPTVEQAAQLTKLAYQPAKTLVEFIKETPLRTGDSCCIKWIPEPALTKKAIPKASPPMQIKNGWLLRGDQLITGYRSGVPWWNGSARIYAQKNSSPAITRFVPGRTGKGLTDDLDALTDSMIKDHIAAMDQNYGLWYDRRRDDHERIRRMDGDVWTPFYELPYARSGKETAWDGLSKYDLTKYNYWYWHRLKQFADLADQKGLLLIHENYFQHNIIEAGAHYADFPWRTANNINDTGFPEPVPYAGDKRIFMAEQFYDTSYAPRRALHKKYIRQCLDNFENNNGVIQLIGEEFTGPLHFVQFWLNTIGEWEKEKGKKQLIGLSTTKDVQDAILNDPYYSKIVDVIDIKYWHYQADGSVYAPQGGQSLAPRQHARLLKPKSSSPEQVYRAVREYRLRFPAKAVLYSADSWDRNGWAVLMAGGSLPNIRIKDNSFLESAATMHPQATISGQWVLENDQTGYIIYDRKDNNVSFDLSAASGNYEVIWIDTIQGDSQKSRNTVKSGKLITLAKPKGSNWILWLKKK